MDLDWGPGNGGETIRLYTCPICGAAVERHARDQHAEWHEHQRLFIDEGETVS